MVRTCRSSLVVDDAASFFCSLRVLRVLRVESFRFRFGSGRDQSDAGGSAGAKPPSPPWLRAITRIGRPGTRSIRL